jgi:tyrosine-protein phosphatase YwqE
MFHFFEKHIKLSDSGLLRDFIDWHCHLLPGIDDGIATLEDTLRALQHYESQGIREVWFTPHVMEDIPNDPNTLQEAFERVRRAYKGPLVLHVAAEYMLDNLFERQLRQHAVLPLGDASHLLVETSYFNPPMDLQGTLSRIQSAGYHPVLAHPERYVYMTERDYRSLHDRRILFQVNLYSLLGMYGQTARRKARWLVDQGLVDRLGTDTHRVEQFLSALDGKLGEKMVKKLSSKA